MTIYLLISNAIIIALGVTVVYQRIKLNRKIAELERFVRPWLTEREVIQMVAQYQAENAAPRSTWPKGVGG